MPRTQGARPERLAAGGRATKAEVHIGSSAVSVEHVVTVRKRGRLCSVGKIVEARPLGALVFAMPYRHRQTVEHVSLPPAVLSHARSCGAHWWVVRNDVSGECFALPLAGVERAGWLGASDGRPEWFVPLDHFDRVVWQTWRYVTTEIEVPIDPLPTNDGQLRLFGGEAAG